MAKNYGKMTKDYRFSLWLKNHPEWEAWNINSKTRFEVGDVIACPGNFGSKVADNLSIYIVEELLPFDNDKNAVLLLKRHPQSSTSDCSANASRTRTLDTLYNGGWKILLPVGVGKPPVPKYTTERHKKKQRDDMLQILFQLNEKMDFILDQLGVDDAPTAKSND